MENKKEEMARKMAEAMNNGAKKVDELVDKRSALGELSPALTVGVGVILVVALIKNPDLLVLGVIGGALAMAPKILKFIKERKAAMQAKKEPAVVDLKAPLKKDDDLKI